jgi:hypothetical protein
VLPLIVSGTGVAVALAAFIQPRPRRLAEGDADAAGSRRGPSHPRSDCVARAQFKLRHYRPAPRRRRRFRLRPARRAAGDRGVVGRGLEPSGGSLQLVSFLLFVAMVRSGRCSSHRRPRPLPHRGQGRRRPRAGHVRRGRPARHAQQTRRAAPLAPRPTAGGCAAAARQPDSRSSGTARSSTASSWPTGSSGRCRRCTGRRDMAARRRAALRRLRPPRSWPGSTSARCRGRSGESDSSCSPPAFEPPIVLSPLVEPCAELARQILDGDLEGLVLKERSAPYRDGSRAGWWKVKDRSWYE